MAEKIIIGPISKGLKTDREPFYIDNDSFPELINAFQWRGKVKRKRGTKQLARLQRNFSETITLADDGSGNGVGTVTNMPIVPGSISFLGSVDGNTYTDPGLDGILVGAPGGSGTINYASGAIFISGTGVQDLTPTVAGATTYIYYPALPVMGIEDLLLTSSQFAETLAFDTTYSYNVPVTSPNTPYDVSFYKNPAVDATNLPGYTPKTTQTVLTWNGENYQQFWSTNYQGAFWVTNGITIPFSTTHLGMQFVHITSVAAPTAGPPGIVTITTAVNHGLVVGDFVFLNEFDPAIITGINLQTGYVTAVPAANQVTIEFPTATLGGPGGASTSGIIQYLTNRIDATKDCIRWYDGDPTTNNGVNGWVNFCPPLSLNPFSIAQQTPGIYYLVTARMIFPFKDRLLFFGPVIQTSTGLPIYLQDTIIYSQNGTPYYTCTFTDTTSNYGIDPTIVYSPILCPINQVATPSSFFTDNTGFGGWISAGVDQPITTLETNEDAIIVGFSNMSTRVIYSGNDILPFNFYIINSELGSASTFSTITMDEGVITRGTKGFIITGQTSSKRFDIDILPNVFEISLSNNGNERFCAQRDFVEEWIYFTYNSGLDTSIYVFPNQTLQFNYREQTWAIFNETYTTYGQFREQTGLTWLTVNVPWNQWFTPWQEAYGQPLNPQVLAGNQQGFLMLRNQNIDEDYSLFIESFSGNTVTSPDHGLVSGDFILINNCLGDIGSQVNGRIFSVSVPDQNTFKLDPPVTSASYIGNGTIKRFYVPVIKSKQFPVSWAMGRKTRIGNQKYLLTKTDKGKVNLLIFLSEDTSQAYNDNSQGIPLDDTIYKTILFTSQESTNMGLTSINSSIDVPAVSSQKQIWHRMQTSLIGDTVQFAITLSDELMREFSSVISYAITDISQATNAVVTMSGFISIGDMVQIVDVEGMIEINNNLDDVNAVYRVISTTTSGGLTTSVTLDVDSSGFTAYSSGGTISIMETPNQEAEIELHAVVIEVSPSQMLV